MDSIELTKFASIILVSLLLIIGGRVLINEVGHGGHSNQVGYKLPTGEPSAAGTGAAEAKPAFDAAKVVAAAASADAGAGEKFMKKCAACHGWEPGKGNGIGPNIHGVVDRAIGSADGYKYSKGLAGKGGNWTLENLATFLHKPKTYVPGTKMIFPGIKKDGDLANVLAYLKSLK